jgi:hypothetical protein
MGPGCSQYEFGFGNGLEFWGPGFSPAVFSAVRSCFMDKIAIEPSFDYLKSWIKVYKNKRKMFLFRTCMVHNFFGETAHKLDELLEDFLIDALGKDGSNNPNMVIRIYSDHGDHINPVIGEFHSTRVEKIHPVMFTMVPAKFAEKYHDNLLANEQRLITHLEIYETAFRYTKQPAPDTEKLGLMPLAKEKYSLFEDRVPAARTCNDIPMYNYDRDCRCYN